jgi:hypothetical protein
MRILMTTFTVMTLASLGEAVFAEPKGSPSKAVPVEKVLNANPEPDGKAYRIDLELRGGKRVSFEISPTEATKLADGLSKPAVAGGERQKVATLVYGMGVEIDNKGLAVVLTPRGRSGPLEPLAIPLAGAEPLVSVLQAKIAEAKANATKPVSPSKQP